MTERGWWHDAVIYELHVRAFADSNGDGIGDFEGLTSRLDYLHELGVTALWLLPFYPSPGRDGGYDIADYRRVDPAYGDLRAFRRFLREAHDRGMRVIIELVLNHTSDQHPWFQRARRAPARSRWRDYYVWSDSPDRYRDARVIFKDFETSNWTWDPVAGAYFWHRFYSHQPDLNYDNPVVQDEILGVVDHWLGLGLDGLRLDAVPYLFERDGTVCENLPETHAFLRRLRAHVDERWGGDRLLLAEANQWPEDVAPYFGDGDECHMGFHFPLMPRLFMGVRQENRTPVVDILEQTPPLPPNCQWSTFLRNHDELTLEMVTDEERDYMYRAYAADPQMRINLGIRRRLAPLLGNDRRKIELLNALLFSLPGTPVLYYGDEIGMGDNVYLGDRDAVRTPMQWSADRNAGFSRASAARLYLPVIVEGAFHYETVNIENQRDDPASLFSFMRQLIAMRRRLPVLGGHDITFLEPDNHRVLAFLRECEGCDPVLVVANLSHRAQSVELELRHHAGATPTEVFGRTDFAPLGEWPYYLTLAPYGFYWFQLHPATRAATKRRFEPPHLRGEWPALVQQHQPELLGALQAWMQERRWFAGKGRPVSEVRLGEVAPVPSAQSGPLRVCAVEVDYVDGDPETYVVPLTVLEGERARLVCTFRGEAVVAYLSDDRPIVDALHDEPSAAQLVRTMGTRRVHGTLAPEPYPELRSVLADEPPPVRLLAVEQSNSSLAVDDSVMVKVVRRLPGGENPDLEVSRHLRDVGFHSEAPLLGSLAWRRNGDPPETLAIAYRFVPNEGDAWAHVLDVLDLFFDQLPAEGPPAAPGLWANEPAAPELGTAGPELVLLGQRTAELHLAMATGEDPAFRPESFTRLYQRSLYQSLRTQLRGTLHQLRRRLPGLTERDRAVAGDVLGGQEPLLARFAPLRDQLLRGVRIRVHGDYHLGQVLFTGRDFVIIDFEGEPSRSLGERRLKHASLRDVAGMLRSFDYAVHVALDDRAERGLAVARAERSTDEWARWWREAASAAFLHGYLSMAGVDTLLPPDPAQAALLLDVLVLEKALYEVRYELDHRPAWVWLPLAVLRESVGVAPAAR